METVAGAAFQRPLVEDLLPRSPRRAHRIGKSPVRPADYVPPVRQYREVWPGHAVMISGEE